MTLLARFLALCFLLAATFAGNLAQAHNLYVLVEAGGPGFIDIIFEHSPYPGKGTYNEPHLVRGKTWIKQLKDDKEISLKLQEKTRLGKKFLQTQSKTKGPRVIVHTCKWGVYKGRLDYFHGKYVDASTPEELTRLARTRKLPLDLVPSIEADGLVVKVFFKDKPLAKKAVSIWALGGKETKQTTDSNGTIKLKNPRPGAYSFAALHTLKKPTGEFNGESYKGVMHGTTCSLRLPVK